MNIFDLISVEKCAIKIIDKTNLDDKARKILSREISCMEKLCHPHLIRMYEVIESVQKLHIVMECASGGELADKIFEAGAYKEADAKPIFLQIAKGLQYMVSSAHAACYSSSYNVYCLIL